jgi:2-phospho-L-lactate guanylyltransferase
MLEQTLTTLKRAAGIDGILVISRDNKALMLARRFEVQTVQESGAPELNDALARATQAVTAWNAQSVLIAASDIPLMTVQDVESILGMGDRVGDVVVIASDRRQEGTNALLVRPPGLIPYRFGTDSFHRHVEEAEKVGATVQVYQSPSLALDVDVPADLELYQGILNGRRLDEMARLGSL